MRTVVKNVAGVFLIIIGCGMLILPGPGLLTILAGLYITNFPGKTTLIKKIRKTKFYNRFLISLEAKLHSNKTRIRSKFKRKIKNNDE
ncbi:MAG: hypothetical protein E3K32_02585 [wastewater metagenome]|nr:hypothetical protein [Candidatus Loosdrechtia aerotolerans]